MGLFSALRRQKPEPEIARAFDPPTYHSGPQRVGLISNGSQPSLSALLAANRGTQALASGAIAARLSSLDLEVVVSRRVMAGTTEEEVLDDHPLGLALDANPVFSLRQLLSLIGYWLTQGGEAYLLKVTDRLRVTRELWPLSPDRMELVADSGLPIGGYVFHSDAGDIRYETSEIVRIWRPDPAAIFQGLGNLGPQALAFDAQGFIDETVRGHYERDAIPKVALKATAGATAPEGATLGRWLKDWRVRFDRRSGTMRGLPAFLPPGFEPHEFASFGGVTENRELMDEYRDRLLMANGVPRSILGDVVDANRAAAETNQYVFDRHAIKPWADLVSEALTRQLARDYDPNLSTRFAQFVADDKDHALAQEAQDLTTKVRTINQVRADRGLDPVEWGEDPVGSFADIPYRPGDDLPGLEEDDPEALGMEPDDQEGDDDRKRAEGGGPAFSSEAAWKVFVMRERKYQAPFLRAIRRVFAEQRDALLEALREGGEKTLASRAGGSRDLLDDLFKPEEWGRLFARTVEPVRRRAFLEVAQDTFRALGAQGSFTLTEQAENILARQAGELIAQATATTKARLRQELTEGVGEGEGIGELEKRVRSVFSVQRRHARTIARTETQRATQAAQVEGFEQSGLVARKRWNTSQDDAVRENHKTSVDGSRMDGQVVDLGDPFVLGDGELSDSPGSGHNGASLSARNAINCRCFLTPVFEGE